MVASFETKTDAILEEEPFPLFIFNLKQAG